MGKYTTIQIKKELYKELHNYCSERGYTKSGLIESLIKQKIQQPNLQNIKPENVLRVDSKISH
jgi:metal-responsive CopG/Arc/MetJ family transcriptional regulator